MNSELAERLRESKAALTEVFRNAGLRRINLALGGSIIGDWAYAVGVSVYAYRQGGATAVGVFGVVRYVSMAVVGPFTAMLAAVKPEMSTKQRVPSSSCHRVPGASMSHSEATRGTKRSSAIGGPGGMPAEARSVARSADQPAAEREAPRFRTREGRASRREGRRDRGGARWPASTP